MQSTEDIQQKFVLFELVDTNYAIHSSLVRRLEMVEKITKVPNAPAELEGIILSQGKIIPAVNLRVRFGFPKSAFDMRTRLVVVESQGRAVGLIVDSAREFKIIPKDEIKPAPESIENLTGEYIEGIATLEGRMVIVLKLDEILRLADQVPASAGPQTV